MLAEAGDAAEAGEHLDAALAIFRHLGARPFVERGEQALASLQSSEETRTC
jgi:hypothetical protein